MSPTALITILFIIVLLVLLIGKDNVAWAAVEV